MDYGISGVYVTRQLDCAAIFRGYQAAQARETIATWRRDYNEVRPHSSIGRIPSALFAEQHRRHDGGAAH
jgi:transposase InsO family protein